MATMWKLLKKNFDIILIIAGSVVVAALGFLNVVEPEIISAAILAILSLIDISLLVNRGTDSQLQQTTEEILERLCTPSIDQVLIPYRKWMEEIERRLPWPRRYGYCLAPALISGKITASSS